MSTKPTESQFLGCVLGQAIGDAVGAPYEGIPSDHVYWTMGPMHELLEEETDEPLLYTDDTQMMIGIVETLLDQGHIQEKRLCQAFVDNYDPERGYGRGARQILQAMEDGDDWKTITQTVFPGGSLGNGAAMRVAPIGILFCDDLDLVMEQAKLSALPTHVHPIGIEAAQLLALAVALVAREEKFSKKRFYRELLHRCESEELHWRLKLASQLGAGDTVGTLGNGLEAHRSVITSIACFTMTPRSFKRMMVRAVGQGDDTDTLAAMAGALGGAHLGLEGVPEQWLARLEDKHKGKTYLMEIGRRLYQLYLQRKESQ